MFDAPWLFYPLIAVVTEIALWVVLSATIPKFPASANYFVAAGWFLLLALLWYFVLARMPDRVRVAAIRRQVPADRLVVAARATRSAEIWIAESMRQHGRRGRVPVGIALVATPTRLEVWMGPQTDPGPVATVNWVDVDSITARPGHACVVRLVLGSTKYAVDVRLTSGRRLAPVLLWGRQRARLIEQLERRRQAAAMPA